MRAVERFLVAALRDGSVLPVLHADQWRALPDLAREHGLSPLMDSLLPFTLAPDDVRAEVRTDTRNALAGQLMIEADLRRLLPVLDGSGVGWAVVKGPVLADHWYRARGQRSYSDLDVLVDPAGFAEALEGLLAAGAVLMDRNWTLALDQRRAEISLQLRHGTVLDLHWHLLNTPELRAEMPLPIPEILSRSGTVSLRSAPVRTLDPEDTLLHLCLHTTLSGGQQLGWYRDVQQVLSHGAVDWDLFVARVTRARAGLPAAVTLRRARQLAGAAVPAGIERHLSPNGRAWRSAVRAADAVRPLGHSGSARLSGRLLVESSRGDTRLSRQALWRSFTHDLLRPVMHDAHHPWRTRTPPPRKKAGNPLWLEPADPADRGRYLAFVGSQAG